LLKAAEPEKDLLGIYIDEWKGTSENGIGPITKLRLDPSLQGWMPFLRDKHCPILFGVKATTATSLAFASFEGELAKKEIQNEFIKIGEAEMRAGAVSKKSRNSAVHGDAYLPTLTPETWLSQFDYYMIGYTDTIVYPKHYSPGIFVPNHLL